MKFIYTFCSDSSAFACYIITAATWLTANPRYFTVPGSFSCALTAIMGCRLILNLCEAYHIPVGQRASSARAHNSIWGATNTRTIRFVNNAKSTQNVDWMTRTVDVIDGRITQLTSESSHSAQRSEHDTNDGDDIKMVRRFDGESEEGQVYALQTIHIETDKGSNRSRISTTALETSLDEDRHHGQLPPAINPPKIKSDNGIV